MKVYRLVPQTAIESKVRAWNRQFGDNIKITVDDDKQIQIMTRIDTPEDAKLQTIQYMKRFEHRITGSIKITLLIAMLVISNQSKAWIAFGLVSGMSRFDATRHLSDNESLVITDGDQQTYAGPKDNQSKYDLTYCSSPQKLFYLRFKLDDSLEVFMKTKEKFVKRYGEPTPLNSKSGHWDSEAWENVEISFLWDLKESETVLLTHTSNGTSAEFQDLSVCE